MACETNLGFSLARQLRVAILSQRNRRMTGQQRQRARPQAGSMGAVLRTMTKVSRLMRFVVTDPGEAWVRTQDQFAERREHRASRCPYDPECDWERGLREILKTPSLCQAKSQFWDLWAEAVRPFKTNGIRIGRGAFGGWGDGEPGLVRAAWYLVRHVRPTNVVETGVARGFTARFILEALEENGGGHLWSIDAPPALKPELLAQVGAAVPESLRHRWSYVRGSSVRRLPTLAIRR